MTQNWKVVGWDKPYKEQLGKDVFSFLEKDKNIIEYLSDYDHITNIFKNTNQYKLTDNSMFALTICKIFEGTLILIAKEMNWFTNYNNSNQPTSIRAFILQHRKKIEQEINSINNITTTNKQIIIDKLFSTIHDFGERHKVAHYGTFLNQAEIENYNSILTKIKEIVSIFTSNNLI